MTKRSIVAIASLALILSASSTQAQFKGAGKYQSGVVEYQTNATDFSFDQEKSKVAIKPSGKGGDGGFTLQLNAKFIDCPAVGNDGGQAGKCGLSSTPVTNHVLEVNLHVLGSLGVKAGLLYNIEKGKTTFVEGGKNKVRAGDLGGALVSVLFSTSVGVDGIRMRETGSDVAHPTTGCAALPLPPANTCADGLIYGIAGFRAGEDPDITCATTAECEENGPQPALICTGGLCAVEPCNVDADCDQNGGGSGGTGQCNCTTDQCCDEATSPGCNAIC